MTQEQIPIYRWNDIETVSNAITSDGKSVVWLHGDPGIGKTTLANSVMEMLEVSHDYERRIGITGFNPRNETGFEDNLILSLARQVLHDIPPKTTGIELKNLVFDALSSTPTLLLLDNAETLDEMWVQGLVAQWLRQCHTCVLLITTTAEPPGNLLSVPAFFAHSVPGLADDQQGRQVTLELLGYDLQERHGEQKLMNVAARLGGNPQRLLYLRWLNPGNSDELEQLVGQLSVEKPKIPNLIGSILQRMDYIPVHFLAFGRITDVEVDEDLLAWLWDQLGGGSVGLYTEVRRRLINEKLLAVGYDSSRLRMSPAVHIELEKYLDATVGKRHTSHVDYYLAEYYRAEYEKSLESLTSPDVRALGRYIAHSIIANNLESALGYILRPSTVTFLHNKGLAMGLRPILVRLDNHLEKTNRRLRKKLLGPHAQVRIELAHCLNDLSEHRKCLEYLQKAEEMLQDVNEEEAFALKQRISHLRGISHSDLGDSDECVKAYMRMVQDGVKRGIIDNRLILVLGYLAFELRFYDTHIARTMGDLAVEMAKSLGEPQILAKNRCSLAQLLFFEDHIPEAAELLEQAKRQCEGSSRTADRRELGRVLLHCSMVSIAQGKYARALRLVKEARAINEISGDRRRQASSYGLEAICRWHLGQKEKAQQLINNAIREHRELCDWRNLSMETLTAAWMRGHKSAVDARRSICDCADEVWAQALGCCPEYARAYDDYWNDKYRPRLLEK